MGDAGGEGNDEHLAVAARPRPVARGPRPPSHARVRVAYVLALWFGCGRFPGAPGTAGTVGAIPIYLVLRPLGIWAVAAGAVAVTLVGVWAAGIVATDRGEKDPQIVCIDEVAGVLVTYLGAPAGWKGTIAGFVVFRVLDQLKPWPAGRAESLRGGWGVVLDDIVAGVWGALLLLGARALGWL